MTPDQIRQMIREEYQNLYSKGQFTTGPIPVHTHTGRGNDAPRLPFIGMYDTPTSYHGNAGKVATVNSTENAIVFSTPSSGGAQTATFVVGPASNSDSASYNYRTTGTDDQDVINTALAALPATGGRIVLREGTYSLSNTITTTFDNSILEGNGDGTILNWDVDSANDIVFLFNNFCWLKNLKIDGKESGKVNQNLGVDIAGGDCIISNCLITNTVADNIYIGGQRASILNNRLDGTQTAAGAPNIGGNGGGAADALIDGNFVLNGAGGGIIFSTVGLIFCNNSFFASTSGATANIGDSSNALVVNNYFEAANGGARAAFSTTGRFTNIVGNTFVVPDPALIGAQIGSLTNLENNTFYVTTEAASVLVIDGEQVSGGRSQYNNTIVGNNIYVTGSHSAGDGMFVINAGVSTSVTNNIIFVDDRKFNNAFAINLSSFSGPSPESVTGTICSDNILLLNNVNGGTNSVGIEVGGQGSVVTGNILYGVHAMIGIDVENSPVVVANNSLFTFGTFIQVINGNNPGVAISGNVIDGFGQGGPGIFCGAASGTVADQISITGNVISNLGVEGISMTAAQHSTICGNTIRNVGEKTTNTYAAILFASDGTTHSIDNIVNGNTIRSTATNKPKYDIREDTASDGPTIVTSNFAQDAVTANISLQNGSSINANNL